MLRTTLFYVIPSARNYIVFHTTWYELHRIISIWAKLGVGILCYDKERDDASCRNIIGHRWVEKSVQLAALQRMPINYWAPMNGKVGATCRPPAASCTSGVYRLFGIDGWFGRSTCGPPAARCPPSAFTNGFSI